MRRAGPAAPASAWARARPPEPGAPTVRTGPAAGQTGAVRVRDWAEVDHYEVLGVDPDADRDAIIAAYRAQARLLHPDAGPTEADADERFVRVTTAYRVLTGPQRAAYDEVRQRGVGTSAGSAGPAGTAGPAGPARPARPWQLTRRGATGAIWGGTALVLAGILAAVVVSVLMTRDARLRSTGVPARAVVVLDGGGPRLEFTTRTGQTVRAALPDAKSGRAAVGDVVGIRYDRADPSRVVNEQHAVARDITLWIMAAKFLIVGTVLVVVGIRRRLRLAD